MSEIKSIVSAVKQKDFQAKIANYWDYYKFHILAIGFVVIMLVVIIVQNAIKPKPDLTVAVFTYSPVSFEHIEKIQDYFEGLIDDVNGDGAIVLNIKNLSVDPETANLQTVQTIHQKLYMEMAGTKTLLYIVDSESEKHFESSEFEGAFANCYALSEAFYNNTVGETAGRLPEDLKIYCRQVAGSVLEEEDGIDQIEKESLALLNKITQ